MDPPLTPTVLAGALLLGGVVLAGLAGYALYRRRRDRRYGALVTVDSPHTRPASIASDRYRLVGRPDSVRRLPDGREVPIELKHRVAPYGGPTRSHRLQVAAYCLLIEATTGRAPPYGVLRYSDGTEFRVPWDGPARAELLEVRRAMARPYRGEATPSPGRCAHCPWRAGCDARSVD